MKGTLTEKNILKAFAGESQARNRYTFFSKVAKSEGYEQISSVFADTALQEEVHAKQFFKMLDGSDIEITAVFPAGKIGNTIENLASAARGENEEWTNLYPSFSETARQEGFSKASTLFRLIAEIEKEHEIRFLKFLKNINENIVFEREEEHRWLCRKCGYIHRGKKALENCPVCNHPKAYFEIYAENY